MSRRVKLRQQEPQVVTPVAPTVFLCAPFQERRVMQVWAAELQRNGIRNVARWVGQHANAVDVATLRRHAYEDIEDLKRAKYLVGFNPQVWHELGSGGRHSELGMGVLLGKLVLIVGSPSQVYHYHDSVIFLPSLLHVMGFIHHEEGMEER